VKYETEDSGDENVAGCCEGVYCYREGLLGGEVLVVVSNERAGCGMAMSEW
jgi:hypothetical protein